MYFLTMLFEKSGKIQSWLELNNLWKLTEISKESHFIFMYEAFQKMWGLISSYLYYSKLAILILLWLLAPLCTSNYDSFFCELSSLLYQITLFSNFSCRFLNPNFSKTFFSKILKILGVQFVSITRTIFSHISSEIKQHGHLTKVLRASKWVLIVSDLAFLFSNICDFHWIHRWLKTNY